MDNTENNKMIAEFMGVTNLISITKLKSIDVNYRPRYSITEDLNYQSSWNCLMPVIEKIELLGYPVTIYQAYTQIESLETMIKEILTKPIIKEYAKDGKIEASYKSVIKFIKWYNENKES